jgi:hypothetical protein
VNNERKLLKSRVIRGVKEEIKNNPEKVEPNIVREEKDTEGRVVRFKPALISGTVFLKSTKPSERSQSQGMIVENPQSEESSEDVEEDNNLVEVVDTKGNKHLVKKIVVKTIKKITTVTSRDEVELIDNEGEEIVVKKQDLENIKEDSPKQQFIEVTDNFGNVKYVKKSIFRKLRNNLKHIEDPNNLSGLEEVETYSTESSTSKTSQIPRKIILKKKFIVREMGNVFEESDEDKEPTVDDKDILSEVKDAEVIGKKHLIRKITLNAIKKVSKKDPRDLQVLDVTDHFGEIFRFRRQDAFAPEDEEKEWVEIDDKNGKKIIVKKTTLLKARKNAEEVNPDNQAHEELVEEYQTGEKKTIKPFTVAKITTITRAVNQFKKLLFDKRKLIKSKAEKKEEIKKKLQEDKLRREKDLVNLRDSTGKNFITRKAHLIRFVINKDGLVEVPDIDNKTRTVEQQEIQELLDGKNTYVEVEDEEGVKKYVQKAVLKGVTLDKIVKKPVVFKSTKKVDSSKQDKIIKEDSKKPEEKTDNKSKTSLSEKTPKEETVVTSTHKIPEETENVNISKSTDTTTKKIEGGTLTTTTTTTTTVIETTINEDGTEVTTSRVVNETDKKEEELPEIIIEEKKEAVSEETSKTVQEKESLKEGETKKPLFGLENNQPEESQIREESKQVEEEKEPEKKTDDEFYVKIKDHEGKDILAKINTDDDYEQIEDTDGQKHFVKRVQFKSVGRKISKEESYLADKSNKDSSKKPVSKLDKEEPTELNEIPRVEEIDSSSSDTVNKAEEVKTEGDFTYFKNVKDHHNKFITALIKRSSKTPFENIFELVEDENSKSKVLVKKRILFQPMNINKEKTTRFDTYYNAEDEKGNKVVVKSFNQQYDDPEKEFMLTETQEGELKLVKKPILNSAVFSKRGWTEVVDKDNNKVVVRKIKSKVEEPNVKEISEGNFVKIANLNTKQFKVCGKGNRHFDIIDYSNKKTHPEKIKLNPEKNIHNNFLSKENKGKEYIELVDKNGNKTLVPKKILLKKKRISGVQEGDYYEVNYGGHVISFKEPEEDLENEFEEVEDEEGNTRLVKKVQLIKKNLLLSKSGDNLEEEWYSINDEGVERVVRRIRKFTIQKYKIHDENVFEEVETEVPGERQLVKHYKLRTAKIVKVKDGEEFVEVENREEDDIIVKLNKNSIGKIFLKCVDDGNKPRFVNKLKIKSIPQKLWTNEYQNTKCELYETEDHEGVVRKLKVRYVTREIPGIEDYLADDLDWYEADDVNGIRRTVRRVPILTEDIEKLEKKPIADEEVEEVSDEMGVERKVHKINLKLSKVFFRTKDEISQGEGWKAVKYEGEIYKRKLIKLGDEDEDLVTDNHHLNIEEDSEEEEDTNNYFLPDGKRITIISRTLRKVKAGEEIPGFSVGDDIEEVIHEEEDIHGTMTTFMYIKSTKEVQTSSVRIFGGNIQIETQLGDRIKRSGGFKSLFTRERIKKNVRLPTVFKNVSYYDENGYLHQGDQVFKYSDSEGNDSLVKSAVSITPTVSKSYVYVSGSGYEEVSENESSNQGGEVVDLSKYSVRSQRKTIPVKIGIYKCLNQPIKYFVHKIKEKTKDVHFQHSGREIIISKGEEETERDGIVDLSHQNYKDSIISNWRLYGKKYSTKFESDGKSREDRLRKERLGHKETTVVSSSYHGMSSQANEELEEEETLDNLTLEDQKLEIKIDDQFISYYCNVEDSLEEFGDVAVDSSVDLSGEAHYDFHPKPELGKYHSKYSMIRRSYNNAVELGYLGRYSTAPDIYLSYNLNTFNLFSRMRNVNKVLTLRRKVEIDEQQQVKKDYKNFVLFKLKLLS